MKKTQPQQFNRRYKSREKCVHEQQISLKKIHGIDSDTLIYVIKDHLLYYENQDAIHEMSLNIITAALSHMYKHANKERKHALLLT